jgi:hypothetical protein
MNNFKMYFKLSKMLLLHYKIKNEMKLQIKFEITSRKKLKNILKRKD